MAVEKMSISGMICFMKTEVAKKQEYVNRHNHVLTCLDTFNTKYKGIISEETRLKYIEKYTKLAEETERQLKIIEEWEKELNSIKDSAE